MTARTGRKAVRPALGAVFCTALLMLAPQPADAQGLFDFLFRRPQPPASIPDSGVPGQQRERTRPRAPKPHKAPPKAAPVAKPPEPEAPPPPYEGDLIRLSETIGSLAFLRALCKEPDAPEWHKRMEKLIDVEAKTETRRARLAGAYNRGYRAYALTYRQCTPSARLSSKRLLHSGERLARSISGRFGE